MLCLVMCYDMLFSYLGMMMVEYGVLLVDVGGEMYFGVIGVWILCFDIWVGGLGLGLLIWLLDSESWYLFV